MRLTFEQKMLSVSILIVTMLLIIIACSDPPESPYTPDNAEMVLITDATGNIAIDSVNHAVKISVIRVMPKFIDSISVKIINSSNLPVMDTVIRINSESTSTDTVLISRSFSLGDRYKVEALAYKEDKTVIYKAGTIRIDGLGNIKPVIRVVGTHSPVIGIPCTLSVFGTDSNAGQVLSYTVTDKPATAELSNSNQRLIWKPTEADTIPYAIKFKVSDDGLPPLSDSSVHVLTVVSKVSNLPKPSKPEDLLVVERKPSTVKLKWNSSKNADSYQVYCVVNDGTTFTLRKSVYDTVYTDSVGVENYRYFVNAHNNAGIMSSDTIPVSAINTLNPIWYQDTFTVAVSEGQQYKLNLPLLCKVANDNELTFSIINVDSIADTITAQKEYLFTPSYADAGNYVFKLKAQQKTLLDTFVIKMAVKNVNRAPEFVQDYVHNSVFVLAGDTLEVPFNTIDADGDLVSYSVKNVGLPRKETLELSSIDGIIRWVSVVADSGCDTTFDLVARDNIDSTVVTVRVYVANGNVGPRWNSKQYSLSVKENQACSLDCSLLANDINGDTLVYSLLTSPPQSDTIIGKMYRYTPGFNDSGSYNGIQLVVSDKVLSDTALLNLNVLNVNRAPVIVNASDTTVPPGTLISFTLSVNDPDSNAIRVLATTLPAGAAFDTLSKKFTFTPVEGTHIAVFQASDGIETTSKTYTIKASNSAIPVFEIQPVSLIRCEGSSALFFVKANAEGAASLNYQWRKNNIPINAQTKDSLVILYPSLSDSGLYDCIVTNGGASKNSNTAKLTVNRNSVKPSTVSASPLTVCVGSIVKLSVSGGLLGTGATKWEWFKDHACDTLLTYSVSTAAGDVISVIGSGVGTKKAYVRAKGTCNETLDSVTYTVAALPPKITVVTASDSSVGLGDTVTLSAKILSIIDGKGSIGDITTIKWYAGGCGGKSIGSGSTLKVVPPSGTTVYYARTENGSCVSACQSVSVQAAIRIILPIDSMTIKTPLLQK